MIEHVHPVTAIASSNEGPCKTILHTTRERIKNNKITKGSELTSGDKVHGQLGYVSNIRYVEMVGV